MNRYKHSEPIAKEFEGLQAKISNLQSAVNTATITKTINTVIDSGGGGTSSYTETDPVFIASAAFGITTDDIASWNAKLASFTETDPTVPSWAKSVSKPTYGASEITTDSTHGFVTDTEKSTWNAKLSSYTETDPVFGASAAKGISSGDISNWNAKLSSYTETDPTVSAWAKAATKPTYTYSEVGAQAPLVSATNIKTINSTTLLGSGNIAVQATLVSNTNIKTVNYNSLLGSGNIAIAAPPAILTANTTVNFTNAQTSSDINASINTQPKNLNGYTLTFQFADGTYSLTGAISFNNFYNGIIKINGKMSEGDILSGTSTLHTNQAVILNPTGTMFYLNYNTANIYIQNLKIAPTGSAFATLITPTYSSYIQVAGCYLLGQTVAAYTQYGIFLSYCPDVVLSNNYFSNVNTCIYSSNCTTVSLSNSVTGTTPAIGLYSSSSTTMKFDATQPAATTPESAVNGGIIR